MSPSWKQVTECVRHGQKYRLPDGKRLGLGGCNKGHNLFTFTIIYMSLHTLFEMFTI